MRLDLFVLYVNVCKVDVNVCKDFDVYVSYSFLFWIDPVSGSPMPLGRQ